MVLCFVFGFVFFFWEHFCYCYPQCSFFCFFLHSFRIQEHSVVAFSARRHIIMWVSIYRCGARATLPQAQRGKEDEEGFEAEVVKVKED